MSITKKKGKCLLFLFSIVSSQERKILRMCKHCNGKLMLTACIFAGMRGIVDYTNYDDMKYAVG